ncbi:MAG: hypothetical protein IJN43_00040 [Ruminococcus sp.]|nr:hypothetical protein [Ruminococcus sp.]
MSVGVFRFKDDNISAQSVRIFFASVASEEFYNRVWTKALLETNIQIFKEGSEFKPTQINDVLEELHRLIWWCMNNLEKGSSDHTYMNNHLCFLIQSISEEASKGDEIFYIF